MFNKLFTCPRARERHFVAPLSAERLRYLTHCAVQGSSRSSLRLLAQHLLVLIDYLHLEADGEIGIEQINTAADLWVSRQPAPHNVTDFRCGRMRFISNAKGWLRFLGRLHPPEVPRLPYTQMIEEFTDYMNGERGLSPETIRTYCFYLSQFFSRFYQQHHTFNEVSIVDIDDAIARKGNRESCGRSSIQTYTASLRTFFRYAEQRGWCAPGLAAAIMSPRVFAEEQLPKGPSWEDAQRLLASTEGDLPKNIRDRAVIMLFVVYGLRVGEVRALRLEDFDWENELLHVTRSKPRRRQIYPLSYTVGEALLRYLKEVRPRVPYREIFITLRAPFHPPARGVLYDVVADRLTALGVSSKKRGPHSLRHACAARLLAEGLSLKEIGDHLGHRHTHTTRVYAKVDLAGLRQVADFDLGGVL
jgi:integrase/recombinase XerD